MNEKMEIGRVINYENYWDKTDSGTAQIISIEDTIFQPADETAPEDMVYTVRDLSSGKEFVIDDIDYCYEKAV